jgi:uncharacterized protein YjbI with pentapeptide repeats
MRLSKGFCLSMIVLIAVVFCNQAVAQNKEEPWTGTLQNGTEISEIELKRILTDSAKWISVSRGNKADLWDAGLSGADLAGANLSGADLSAVVLSGANLS